jgi:Phosphatidylserine/phosphatidylglycerophosphate/cardiolipin synthases and related enzymes
VQNRNNEVLRYSTLGFLLLCVALAGCQTFPENKQEKSFSITDTSQTRLARNLGREASAHSGESGFSPLFSGHDAITARLFSIQEAEKSIDLQTYIWHDDLTGNITMYFLLQAAERGVRVRLLMDALREEEWAWKMRALAQHPMIEVRSFNPYHHRTVNFLDYLTRFSEANRRMHNKAFIVDHQVAIVGGRNVGDEYFQASPDLEFGDIDVMTLGPVVSEIADNFDRFWNSDLAYPIELLYAKEELPSLEDLKSQLTKMVATEDAHHYAKLLKDSPYVEELRRSKVKTHWAPGKMMSDGPEKIRSPKKQFQNLIGKQLEPYFADSKKEILIISPYLVPGAEGVRRITNARNAGVRVVLLTNSFASNDVALVHHAYARYRKSLLKAGVEIYELKAQFKKSKDRKFLVGGSSRAGLHGKVFVFDEHKAFIGSMNLDPRSEFLNTEMGVMIESIDFSSNFMNDVERRLDALAYKVELNTDGAVQWREWTDGKEIVYLTEPEVSIWKRMWYGFVSVFVPENWL